MIRTISVLFFLCCVSVSEAQHSHYFQLPETGHIPFMINSNISKTHNEGVVWALGNAPRHSFPSRIYFIELDQHLNIVSHHPVLSTNGLEQDNPHVFSDKSKTYIINTLGFGGVRLYYQMIILDSNKVILDSAYTKFNFSMNPSFISFDRLNKRFLSFGLTYVGGSNYYAHLLVIDTMGNIIEQIDYKNLPPKAGESENTLPVGFVLLKDGSMLLLYDKRGSVPRELLVYKINKDYTLESQEPKSIFKHLVINRVQSLIEMDDGRVRFIAIADLQSSVGVRINQSYICTITPDGDSSDIVDIIEDERWALRGNKYMRIGSIVPTDDGNFMYLIGLQDSIQGDRRVGFVVRADINYNILSPQMRIEQQELRTIQIIPTKDGGFFRVGIKDNPDPNKNYFLWIMRCDSNGKITSTKQVEIKKYQVEEINLSPNPASTQVHIESPIKIENYTLTSTSGKIIQSDAMEASNSIDISRLPSGLYFLQLHLANGQTVMKKVVKD